MTTVPVPVLALVLEAMVAAAAAVAVQCDVADRKDDYEDDVSADDDDCDDTRQRTALAVLGPFLQATYK